MTKETRMPIQTRYLFSAAMSVRADKDALFNEVYDTEHVPALLGVPGVIAVARFKSEPVTMMIGGARRLMALGEAFTARGLTVVRYDLPCRQASRTGPPRPAGAARDREGLRQAVAAMRSRLGGRVFLGGQSYGGRQASMLAAGEAG